MCTCLGHFQFLYAILLKFSTDFEHSKLLNKVLIFVHAIHNGNDVDAFSDDLDVILNSNQVVFEPIDRHKLMTTGCKFG